MYKYVQLQTFSTTRRWMYVFIPCRVPSGQKGHWAPQPVMVAEKNPCPCQELIRHHPACSLITILGELPWISSAIQYQYIIFYYNIIHFWLQIMTHARYICTYLLLQNYFFVILRDVSNNPWFNNCIFFIVSRCVCSLEHIWVQNDWI
jgi:hypothetical protein